MTGVNIQGMPVPDMFVFTVADTEVDRLVAEDGSPLTTEDGQQLVTET
jgi:hypothetical protein